MDQTEEQSDRADVISRMFALLTARFEDAAMIAMEGQGHHAAEQLTALARELQSLIDEAVTLTCAVLALLEPATGPIRGADDK